MGVLFCRETEIQLIITNLEARVLMKEKWTSGSVLGAARD